MRRVLRRLGDRGEEPRIVDRDGCKVEQGVERRGRRRVQRGQWTTLPYEASRQAHPEQRQVGKRRAKTTVSQP